VDRLPLGNKRALMQKAEDYTVFIKNSVAFPYFGGDFLRDNLIGEQGKPCMYKRTEDGGNNGCQIFRLGDMIANAGGNFSRYASKHKLRVFKHGLNMVIAFLLYCLFTGRATFCLY
jgi:hypothetical protein